MPPAKQSSQNKFTSEFEDLKKSVDPKLDLDGGNLLGKRAGMKGVKDQSVFTQKESNDLENMVVHKYYRDGKGQLDFFGEVEARLDR